MKATFDGKKNETFNKLMDQHKQNEEMKAKID